MIRPDYEMFSQPDFVHIWLKPSRDAPFKYAYNGIRTHFLACAKRCFGHIRQAAPAHGRIAAPWRPRLNTEAFIPFLRVHPVLQPFSITARMLEQPQFPRRYLLKNVMSQVKMMSLGPGWIALQVSWGLRPWKVGLEWQLRHLAEIVQIQLGVVYRYGDSAGGLGVLGHHDDALADVVEVRQPPA